MWERWELVGSCGGHGGVGRGCGRALSLVVVFFAPPLLTSPMLGLTRCFDLHLPLPHLLSPVKQQAIRRGVTMAPAAGRRLMSGHGTPEEMAGASCGGSCWLPTCGGMQVLGLGLVSAWSALWVGCCSFGEMRTDYGNHCCCRCLWCGSRVVCGRLGVRLGIGNMIGL